MRIVFSRLCLGRSSVFKTSRSLSGAVSDMNIPFAPHLYTHIYTHIIYSVYIYSVRSTSTVLFLFLPHLLQLYRLLRRLLPFSAITSNSRTGAGQARDTTTAEGIAISDPTRKPSFFFFLDLFFSLRPPGMMMAHHKIIRTPLLDSTF